MVTCTTPVTAVILAGGLSTRMGGSKGLQMLQGKALIAWVLDAVKDSSAEVLINANETQEVYAQFGYRVIVDQMPDWPGPLAGLQAALCFAQTEYVLTVPCDTPFLPHKLIEQLLAVRSANGTEAAVAKVDGHRQPTIALYSKNVLPKLNAYLSSGRRKVNDWLDTLSLSEAVFENASDFDNINTQDDLKRVTLAMMKAESSLEKRK